MDPAEKALLDPVLVNQPLFAQKRELFLCH
jgi:hypothetical protein